MSAYHNHTHYLQNEHPINPIPDQSSNDDGSWIDSGLIGSDCIDSTQLGSTRRIAELIIPVTQQSHSILSPIAASFSKHNEQQWTTWITYRKPSKALLKQMGAELSRLRIIVIDKNKDVRWLVWQALAQGNSHSIIAEQTQWTAEDIQSMQDAAVKGRCEALLVTVH